jgi:glycoprotein-N-acetylgalactosamine 3-beta-galactosyltransferase
MSQRPYRILCWTLTDPFDLEKRTKYVRDTWAKRCDKMLFMSSARNDSFPTVGLNVTAGRNHIGAKAKAAWNYIYEHHREDADYFIKGDPDTYFVVDNLRRYLASRDPRVPEFFGHRLFITGPNVTYVSGGSGLVISRESLNRLIEAFQQTPDCLVDGQGRLKCGYSPE